MPGPKRRRQNPDIAPFLFAKRPPRATDVLPCPARLRSHRQYSFRFPAANMFPSLRRLSSDVGVFLSGLIPARKTKSRAEKRHPATHSGKGPQGERPRSNSHFDCKVSCNFPCRVPARLHGSSCSVPIFCGRSFDRSCPDLFDLSPELRPLPSLRAGRCWGGMRKAMNRPSRPRRKRSAHLLSNSAALSPVCAISTTSRKQTASIPYRPPPGKPLCGSPRPAATKNERHRSHPTTRVKKSDFNAIFRRTSRESRLCGPCRIRPWHARFP